MEINKDPGWKRIQILTAPNSHRKKSQKQQEWEMLMKLPKEEILKEDIKPPQAANTSANTKLGENTLMAISLGYIAILLISNYKDALFSYFLLFLALVILAWRFSGFIKSKIVRTKPPQGLDISKIKTVGEFHDEIVASKYTASPDLYRGLQSLMKVKNFTFPEAFKFLSDNKKVFITGNWYIYDLSASKLWEKKTPEGFIKCEVCGEYKGKTNKKNLNWGMPLSDEELEDYVGASCICEGILCPKCKTNNIRRPGSNEYDEENNQIWHSPILPCAPLCSECRSKK